MTPWGPKRVWHQCLPLKESKTQKSFVPGCPAKVQRSEEDKLVSGSKNLVRSRTFSACSLWMTIYSHFPPPSLHQWSEEWALFLDWWTEEGLGVQEICDTPKKQGMKLPSSHDCLAQKIMKTHTEKSHACLGKCPAPHYRIPVTGEDKNRISRKENK